jgi:acyl-CoA thioester hydrolase
VSIDRFRHRVPLRVRWAEVDMQAVVFNGHYLTYADVCATEYWRAIGVPYPAGFAALDIDAFVRKATVEYHAPARYDDELLVCGRMARLGRSSADFAVGIYRAADTSRALVDAELVYVCVDRDGRPAGWPAPMRARMRGYEAVAPTEEGPGA